MKKFILLMLISCNANAAAAAAVMLMTQAHRQDQKVLVDGKNPTLICKYDISRDTCLIGLKKITIGQFVAIRGYTMFKRREYLNSNNTWYLIMDVYK